MRRGIGRLLAAVGDNRRRRSVRWASADDRVRQRSTETHHGWRRSTPAKKQLEVYAARVYVAEDEGGYIWLNLSMLSQDKATRVVRVPVGLLVDADGQQNGDRRTDLANHGSSFPRWRRQGTALRRCCGRASRGRRSIRRSRAQLGACCQEYDATDAASQRFSASSSGDLASSRPVGSPRQVPAGDGPYALTSSAPCPHRRSALRADRPTGPRCVIGGRRCTGTTAENHPVVWLDDPRRHIDGDYCPAVAGSRIRVAVKAPHK